MPNTFIPYLTLDEGVRAHMEKISTCREPQCLVPQAHPFYPVPELPPFYYGRRPCMPVVPTRLNIGGVMVLGLYPNCRRATAKPAAEQAAEQAEAEAWVPVEDADEPFEYSRYFDTYGVRDLRAGTILQKAYWAQLELDREKDLWITNIVKCFLFEQVDLDTVQRLGWNDPPVSQTRTRYFEIAAVCAGLYLAREIELCKPKLVISMGGEGCRFIHGRTDPNDNDAQSLFRQLRGKLLCAGVKEEPLDTRTDLFRDLNVLHLYHPSGLSLTNLDQHLQDMDNARHHLVELGLAPQTLLQHVVETSALEEIKSLIRASN
jgi:uracil-DNA glycosylase